MTNATLPPTTPLRSRVESTLEQWLGLTFPSAPRALAEAAFVPDSAAFYCARCGQSIGQGEATERGCASCRGEAAIADRFVRLGPYEQPLRSWIPLAKYERWVEIGGALGVLLARQIEAVETIDREMTIVVPVPMPWQRRLYRGIDHARVLADAVAKTLRVDRFDILAKVNGPTQMSRTATDRRRARREWMRLRRRIGGWPLDDLTVILVDDVKTTGVTLRTAGRLLRDCGAKRLVAATVAVADERGRRARTHSRIHGGDSADPPSMDGADSSSSTRP